MTKNIFKNVSFLLAITVLFSIFSITESFAYKELLSNSTFDNGVSIPWQLVTMDTGKASCNVSDGKLNVTIQDPGDFRWDVQMRYKGLSLEKGRTYNVRFTVSSTKNCKIYAKVGDQGEPYNEYWNYNNVSWAPIVLEADKPKTVSEKFTMPKSAAPVELAFHLGGELASSDVPYTISFDDIYLTDDSLPDPYPEIPPEPTNKIRVNQTGYFPYLNKIATLVSYSSSPVDWNLVNGEGITVATGKTIVKGFDKSSGDNVHIINFSAYTTQGQNYKLVSGNDESLPFDIGVNLYHDLKYQSLKYFYYNRSGIPIQMPYSDSIELVRNAINPNDVLRPNPSESYNGDYYIDITGGWIDDDYDGKSVVKSSIATWTLMNQYEYALNYGRTGIPPYEDNSINIPESGNGYPDILDEARYSLENILKMQVPAGNQLSGMVHHQVKSEKLLSLTGTETSRYLQPPTTTATLDLAAVAAQGSRLWRQYDADFANKCLAAAEAAWDAAIANPDVFVEPNVIDSKYGDDYAGDEFYWAASELYITTGKDKYFDYIKNSEHYLEIPTKLTGGIDVDSTGCFDWCNTAGLGTLSLVISQNNLPDPDMAVAKANIINAANKFISIADSQGYGVPIEECTIKGLTTDNNGEVSNVVGFPYSSNSYILNEAIIMAYAYNFSNNIKYLNGITGAMDYILGRNPMVQSYITGYGDNPLENPHHILWAYQYDISLPKPPAGCLASGPNSGLQDPWVKGAGWKLGEIPPEKCFMDYVDSWSTNEIDISLNAPLAWVSAFIDENVTSSPPLTYYYYGDVNEDDNVDALDLALIKKYLLTSDISLIHDENRADVNGDGSVDALDYALVKMFLLKSIDIFPVQEQ